MNENNLEELVNLRNQLSVLEGKNKDKQMVMEYMDILFAITHLGVKAEDLSKRLDYIEGHFDILPQEEKDDILRYLYKKYRGYDYDNG